MRRFIYRAGLWAALAFGATAYGGEFRTENAHIGIPGEYVVVYKSTATAPGVRGIASARALSDQARAAHGAQVREVWEHALKGAQLSMSEAAARRLAADPSVAYVEPVIPMRVTATQSGATWGIDRVDQRDLPLSGTYTYNNTASNVHVYVIDTGIYASHSQFSGRVGNGYTVINDGYGTGDCHGHGTHVAGTVGGTTYGVAKGVTLHSVRVFGCAGDGTNATVISGANWVAQNRILPAVANLSLGGSAAQSVDTAINNLAASGVLPAVAAGNESVDACTTSPARASGAFTVGATTSSDSMSSFSNYGSCVDIWAPGSSILSSYSNGGTATMSGTSMATPHVAGAAALYIGANPGATVAQIRSALTSNGSANRIRGLVAGPNLLLYTGFIGGGTTQPPPPATVLQNGVPRASLSASTGVQLNFTLDVPAGATNLQFVMSGGTGDADMHVRFGSAPTLTTYDCRPFASGNNETCNIATAQAGRYYVMLNAFSAFSGVTLTGSYTGGGTGNTPPVANFSFTTSGLTATFTDSSTDANGTIASRSWNFGDGTTSTATNPSKTYSAAGTYTVTLTVTDNQGATNSTSRSVTVGGTTPPPTLPECTGSDLRQLGKNCKRSNRSKATGNYDYLYVSLPAGVPQLKITVSGGTGNANVYVSTSTWATQSNYQYSSTNAGNSETLTITSPPSGYLYISLHAASAFSGVTVATEY